MYLSLHNTGALNRGKTAYSSSLRGDDATLYDPSHLNDGDRHVLLADNTCTMTQMESQPWWAVNLANIYWIDDVFLVNVGDNEGENTVAVLTDPLPYYNFA